MQSADLLARRTARWVNPELVYARVTRWRGHGLNYAQRNLATFDLMGRAIADIADQLHDEHDTSCDCRMCNAIRAALTTMAAYDEMGGEA